MNIQVLYDYVCALCTYQCNAPLPQERAEVGEGGDLHSWKLQSPTNWGSIGDTNPHVPQQISQ